MRGGPQLALQGGPASLPTHLAYASSTSLPFGAASRPQPIPFTPPVGCKDQDILIVWDHQNVRLPLELPPSLALRFIYDTFVACPVGGPRRCVGCFASFTDSTKRAIGRERFHEMTSNGILNVTMINSAGGARKAHSSDHPLIEAMLTFTVGCLRSGCPGVILLLTGDADFVRPAVWCRQQGCVSLELLYWGPSASRDIRTLQANWAMEWRAFLDAMVGCRVAWTFPYPEDQGGPPAARAGVSEPAQEDDDAQSSGASTPRTDDGGSTMQLHALWNAMPAAAQWSLAVPAAPAVAADAFSHRGHPLLQTAAAANGYAAYGNVAAEGSAAPASPVPRASASQRPCGGKAAPPPAPAPSRSAAHRHRQQQQQQQQQPQQQPTVSLQRVEAAPAESEAVGGNTSSRAPASVAAAVASSAYPPRPWPRVFSFPNLQQQPAPDYPTWSSAPSMHTASSHHHYQHTQSGHHEPPAVMTMPVPLPYADPAAVATAGAASSTGGAAESAACKSSEGAVPVLRHQVPRQVQLQGCARRSGGAADGSRGPAERRRQLASTQPPDMPGCSTVDTVAAPATALTGHHTSSPTQHQAQRSSTACSAGKDTAAAVHQPAVRAPAASQVLLPHRAAIQTLQARHEQRLREQEERQQQQQQQLLQGHVLRGRGGWQQQAGLPLSERPGCQQVVASAAGDGPDAQQPTGRTVQRSGAVGAAAAPAAAAAVSTNRGASAAGEGAGGVVVHEEEIAARTDASGSGDEAPALRSASAAANTAAADEDVDSLMVSCHGLTGSAAGREPSPCKAAVPPAGGSDDSDAADVRRSTDQQQQQHQHQQQQQAADDAAVEVLQPNSRPMLLLWRGGRLTPLPAQPADGPLKLHVGEDRCWCAADTAGGEAGQAVLSYHGAPTAGSGRMEGAITQRPNADVAAAVPPSSVRAAPAEGERLCGAAQHLTASALGTANAADEGAAVAVQHDTAFSMPYDMAFCAPYHAAPASPSWQCCDNGPDSAASSSVGSYSPQQQQGAAPDAAPAPKAPGARAGAAAIALGIGALTCQAAPLAGLTVELSPLTARSAALYDGDHDISGSNDHRSGRDSSGAASVADGTAPPTCDDADEPTEASGGSISAACAARWLPRPAAPRAAAVADAAADAAGEVIDAQSLPAAAAAWMHALDFQQHEHDDDVGRGYVVPQEGLRGTGAGFGPYSLPPQHDATTADGAGGLSSRCRAAQTAVCAAEPPGPPPLPSYGLQLAAAAATAQGSPVAGSGAAAALGVGIEYGADEELSGQGWGSSSGGGGGGGSRPPLAGCASSGASSRSKGSSGGAAGGGPSAPIASVQNGGALPGHARVMPWSCPGQARAAGGGAYGADGAEGEEGAEEVLWRPQVLRRLR